MSDYNPENRYPLFNNYIIACDDLIEDGGKCSRCLQNLAQEGITCWKKEQ